MAISHYAAIEAGGTKFICALFRDDGEIVARTRIPTTTPDETLRAARQFLHQAAQEHGDVSATGIASFGPLNLDPTSSAYGSIVSTPKVGWSGVNMLSAFRDALGAPVFLDTDVNCAAIAEGRLGAAQGCETHCYMTVGTGIGVGLVVNNQLISGLGHAEVGHMRVSRASGDTFAGRCPYHGDCVEGLACGPAMQDRWGQRPEDLPEDHPAWPMQAHYVAAICTNLIYTLRPQRIVIGGGVFERRSLYGRVRTTLKAMLADYALSSIERDLDVLITPPGLTDVAPGLLGAYELARTRSAVTHENAHAY